MIGHKYLVAIIGTPSQHFISILSMISQETPLKELLSYSALDLGLDTVGTSPIQ